jgi:hypothetical protein
VTHIYPLNDEREHVLEGHGCWCEPRLLWNDPETEEPLTEGLVIHNAADCREIIEQAEALNRMWSDTQ